MPTRYKYRTYRGKKVLKSSKPNIVAEEPEQLAGSVDGDQASDIEERFARALKKRKKDFIFRMALGDRYQPGWKELDFLVIDGGYFPIEIDETGFIHQGKQTEDAIKDAFIMDYLKDYSPQPVRRIPGERLNTQELADYTAKELFP